MNLNCDNHFHFKQLSSTFSTTTSRSDKNKLKTILLPDISTPSNTMKNVHVQPLPSSSAKVTAAAETNRDYQNISNKFPKPFVTKVVSKAQSNSTVSETNASANGPLKGPRKLKLITGRIDYAIKMSKLHPDIEALFEIYGKIVKMQSGKIKTEQLMLLRNEFGPLLQTVFYNCSIPKMDLKIGAHIRCIGRFKNTKRFHIFKIYSENDPPNEKSLARIQNVCNFAINH